MTEARANRIQEVLCHRQPDLTVVLENVFDIHNISAIMRTADAVGVTEIFVIHDRQPPPGRWGYRSSSGAYKWMIVHHFDNVEACMTVVRSRYQHVFTTHLSSDAVSVYEMDLCTSMALVFGNEQKGVSETLRAMADGNFIIPQVGMIRSLNISVACAIALYEAFRQRKQQGLYQQQRLPQPLFDQLQQEWSEPFRAQ